MRPEFNAFDSQSAYAAFGRQRSHAGQHSHSGHEHNSVRAERGQGSGRSEHATQTGSNRTDNTYHHGGRSRGGNSTHQTGNMAQLKRGMKYLAKLNEMDTGARPQQANEAISTFQTKVSSAIETALSKLPERAHDLLASARHVFNEKIDRVLSSATGMRDTRYAVADAFRGLQEQLAPEEKQAESNAQNTHDHSHGRGMGRGGLRAMFYEHMVQEHGWGQAQGGQQHGNTTGNASGQTQNGGVPGNSGAANNATSGNATTSSSGSTSSTSSPSTGNTSNADSGSSAGSSSSGNSSTASTGSSSSNSGSTSTHRDTPSTRHSTHGANANPVSNNTIDTATSRADHSISSILSALADQLRQAFDGFRNDMRDASVQGLEQTEGKSQNDLDFERFLTMFRDMLTEYLEDGEAEQDADAATEGEASATAEGATQAEATDATATNSEAVAAAPTTTAAQPETPSIDLVA